VRTTALFQKHQNLGAAFTDFGGWNMPVRYGSDLDEHHAVRNSAGLFDISHMAQISVLDDAANFLDYAVVSKVSALANGRAKYTMICNDQGGIIDDLIVYRIHDNDYLVIANASNREAVFAQLSTLAKDFDVELQDHSLDSALLALQGPRALEILSELVDIDPAPLKYYSIAPANLDGVPVLLARTGYTGEDGFEISMHKEHAEKVWDLILKVGGDRVRPCGLAARDTLRLEAGMPLYGHELDLETIPQEAGLGRVVSQDKDSFVGKTALAGATPRKLLHAIVGEGRRAARADYEIFYPGSDQALGKVTSGALSPTLGYPVAMAYLNVTEQLAVGTKLEADVRGTRVSYGVVAMPFYKREGK
jgi:aminomethyltransferase